MFIDLITLSETDINLLEYLPHGATDKVKLELVHGTFGMARNAELWRVNW